MASAIKYIEEHGYVSVILEGDVSIEELAATREESAALMTEKQCLRLFVDSRDESEMNSISDDFDFSSEHFKYFPPPIKTAVLVHDDHAKHMQFVEDVSQNRGVNLMVFVDKGEALRWLFAT